MSVFLLLLAAYIIGFFTAIPIGATQVEIAKRALNHKLFPAAMVVLGSVSSDVMYGGIAFFGVAPLLRHHTVVGLFELTGTLILWIFAFFTFRDSRKPHLLNLENSRLQKKRLSFITGFSLAVTNPLIVFWWLLEIQFVKQLGLVDNFTSELSAAFLLFGGLGLGSYLMLLASVLYRVKRFISNSVMKKLYLAMGVILILLSFFFLYNSIKYLFS